MDAEGVLPVRAGVTSPPARRGRHMASNPAGISDIVLDDIEESIRSAATKLPESA